MGERRIVSFHCIFSNTSPENRVRHKKCDETRPSCINCSSTGRKCDGYAEIQPRSERSHAASVSHEWQTSEGSENVKGSILKAHVRLPIAMADPCKIGLSAHECFFLDFFRNVGAFDFAGYPIGNFLNVLVRQIGESQPSVKHASIALTSMGHTRAQAYFDDGRGKLKDFALRQTRTSISHLPQQPTSEDLLSRRAHREVVMTMRCILALLAQTQNELETYKMHLAYGLRAMQEWQDADFDGSSIAPMLSVLLADLNWRLQIASKPASFPQDDNPLLLNASCFCDFNVSTAEYTVNPHWEQWSHIMLRPDQGNRFASNPDCPDRILLGSRIAFLFKVRIYSRHLKACLDQVRDSAAPQSIRDLSTALRLWDQFACAIVAAALGEDEGAIFRPSQMKYDAAFAYFRRVNEFGKKILQSQARQNVSAPTFPIDYAVGTPLFFCGFYCRDWSTRREALRLLKALEERFRGSDAIALLPMKISALERIIDIESHGLQPGNAVPEVARIHYVEYTGRPGSSDILFSYCPVGMDGLVEIL